MNFSVQLHNKRKQNKKDEYDPYTQQPIVINIGYHNINNDDDNNNNK